MRLYLADEVLALCGDEPLQDWEADLFQLRQQLRQLVQARQQRGQRTQAGERRVLCCSAAGKGENICLSSTNDGCIVSTRKQADAAC